MILPLLLRFWPYIAIGLLTLGLYAAIRHDAKTGAKLDAAIEISNSNAQVAEQERTARQRADDIAAKASAEAEKARQLHSINRQRITNAPQSDDGVIAPVLRRQLDRLRQPDANAAGTRTPTADSAKPS